MGRRSLKYGAGLRSAPLLLLFLPAVLFSVLPIAWLVLKSSRSIIAGDIMLSDVPWSLLAQTFALSLAASLLAALLGFGAGICLNAVPVRARAALRLLLLTPFAVPPYLLALGWGELLRMDGAFSALTAMLPGLSRSAPYHALNSPLGVVLIWAMAFFPICSLYTEKALSLLSSELFDAARTLGASRWQVFRWVLWPLTRTAVLTGGMVVFLLTGSEMGVPTLLRVNTFNSEVFVRISAFNDLPAGTILMLPFLAVGMPAYMIVRRWAWANTHAMSAQNAVPRLALSRPAANRRAALIVIVAILIMCGLPLLGMLTTAIAGGAQYLPAAMAMAKTPALYSIAYAAGTAFVSVGLMFPLSWWLGRAPRSASPFGADMLLVPGFAVPSAMLALGVLTVVQDTGMFSEIGPSILIVGTLAARYMVVVFLVLAVSVRQIPQVLLEVPRVFGASRWYTLRRVHIPLLEMPLIAAFMTVFLLAFGEIGAVILLYPPGGETLPIALYAIEANGPRGLVATLATFNTLCAMAPCVLGSVMLVPRPRRGISKGMRFRAPQ